LFYFKGKKPEREEKKEGVPPRLEEKYMKKEEEKPKRGKNTITGQVAVLRFRERRRPSGEGKRKKN